MDPLTVNLTLLILLQPTVAPNNGSCWTPDRKQGSCIFLEDCPHLYSSLKYTAHNKTIADHLRSYICEFVGIKTKVCCENQQKHGGIRPSVLPRNCGQYTGYKLPTQYAMTGQYPWNVLLVYRDDEGCCDKFLCAGTLISDRYVLTAAHCVTYFYLPTGTKLKRVRLGENNLETNPDCDGECAPPYVEVEVEDIVVHEGFRSHSINQYHDIALIRLKRAVSFTLDISPVCLPNKHDGTDGYEEWTGAGWGIWKNKRYSNVKKRIFAEVRNASFCAEVLPVTLSQDQTCLGKTMYDFYADDSGGGMFVLNYDATKYFINGVMSLGTATVEDYPRIYIKVENYVDWIISKLKP